MRRRYRELVMAHLQATQGLASGIHSLPGAAASFAATQAAYRFLNNHRISLRDLARPLIDAGRQEAAAACGRYLLVVHDGSQLMYPEHAAKRDRVMLSSKHVPEGYELQTALLVCDRDGSPLAPAVLSLRAADGVHCSPSGRIRTAASPLDELDPTMTFIERQRLGFPLVHLVDAEADSVGHYRTWSGRPAGCSWFARTIGWSSTMATSENARQFASNCDNKVASPKCATTRARCWPRGKLLSNVPCHVDARTLALWCYWRWTIEVYQPECISSAGLYQLAA